MERRSFADVECPIARATDQIGDAWSLLILRSAFLGVRSFQEFEQRLEAPSSTLSRKLQELCEGELLRKVRYSWRPPRSEYRLTDKARELLPLLLLLAAWGNRWLAPDGAPLVAIQQSTRRPLEPVLYDAHTQCPIALDDVALTAGPGASAALRRALSSPMPFGAPEPR